MQSALFSDDHNITYWNKLSIASELDVVSEKISDCSYELLLHASEEREESERRLMQSYLFKLMRLWAG